MSKCLICKINELLSSLGINQHISTDFSRDLLNISAEGWVLCKPWTALGSRIMVIFNIYNSILEVNLDNVTRN